MNHYNTSEEILTNIAQLIHIHSGISFPDSHLKVLDQRIQEMLKTNNYSEQDLYSDLLLNKKKLLSFIGFVTTNHTLFFRSIEQFHVLGSTILPELLIKNQYIKHIYIWSCACSSGEEPYTLALYLSHYFKTNNLDEWGFSILATDIDETSLQKGVEGIYSYDALKNIPEEYHSYFTIKDTNLNNTNIISNKSIQINSEIQKHVQFKFHNLIEASSKKNFDIIFCRNVLIYFDTKTQEKVLNSLTNSLSKDRYLLISPSESVTGLDVPLTPVILPKCIYYTN